MSIGQALSNALSGLAATSRGAAAISSNLANALNEDYGTRRVVQAARQTGGVGVAGVSRQIDSALLSERRLADGAFVSAQVLSGFWTALERRIGPVEAAGSLASQITGLETALVTAASRPEDENRLRAAIQEAGSLAGKFNQIENGLQKLREQAEAGIADAVKTLNSALAQVQSLNDRIMRQAPGSAVAAAMMDQRQSAVDRIADLVALREVPRVNGTIALYTQGGARLLDGAGAEFAFTRSGVITPDMTLENGALSGLVMDGLDIGTPDMAPLSGGRIAALFELRDDLAVQAQSRIDALAGDLAERFQQPGLDSTRAAADPGLFTDKGARFDPANTTGIAGRLRLDPAIAGPDMAYRLRDGLKAAGPGEAGNAALLQDLVEALRMPRARASGNRALSAAAQAGSLNSWIGQNLLTDDQKLSIAGAERDALARQLQEQGVDTDAEMQRLLLVERAYAANARVFQVIDDMLQNLLRI